MMHRRLTDGEYVDGNIQSPAQVMAEHVAELTLYKTIADKDHEMFYFDKKSKIWREDGENFIWKALAERYPQHTKPMLNEVLHFIQGQTLLPREKFKPPKNWLAFKNCGIDIEHNFNEELIGPQHYFRNRFPVDFKPFSKCPRFHKFLAEIIPDPEDRFTLCQGMAMVLIPHLNFEKAFMFIGKSSANGKSTIMKIMRKLFGSENIISISLQNLIYNRFMGSRLDGKLLNTYADINANLIKDLDIFKLFVSGDSVTVEKKNGHPYEIIPITKHYFSTNTLPEISEDNAAVYRRFMIIEFPNSFEDCKDLELLEKLTTKEELEGIMWYLSCLAKLMIKDKKFRYEQTPEDIRIKWKEESNPVFELIKHSKLIIEKPDSRISYSKIYSIYAKFCTSKHYSIKPPGSVTRIIRKLGYQPHKRNGIQYWLGLTFNQLDPKQKLIKSN